MKRVGNLMPLIADMENLREAFLLAVKGKSMRPETIRFRDHLDGNLLFLHRQLLDGSYRPPAYRRFTVWDPKERTICAAPFHERVVQHAMMRVCHRLFDDFQMSHSFASRLGMGTYKAIDHAQHCSRSNKWFLKLDVTKYFDSIGHEVLYGLLSRIVKDRLLLHYWQQLLDSTSASGGLPAGITLTIGNLTSQYWANHYLAVADHKAKEQLHTGKMARYMDDVVMWRNDRQELLRQGRLYEEMVRDELQLELHPFCLNRTEHGMPFLRGSNRVNRGGSWNNNATNCRVANRNRNTPTNTNNNLGLRLAPQPSPQGLCNKYACPAGRTGNECLPAPSGSTGAWRMEDDAPPRPMASG